MATLNTLWARALVQELVRGGVRHAVVCPGSRSAPLALACAEAESALRVWSVLDERTAGFFALGLALETGQPTALVVTSGTAGAHLLPAVMEAWAAHVPLVLLTANRPWELHGFGAPQTVPQEGLFGRFTRGALALAAPEPTTAAFLHLRAVVARSVSLSQASPRGPVHLDVPFREPLAPVAGEDVGPSVLSALAREGREGSFVASPAALRRPPEDLLTAVRGRLTEAAKGVVVVGPHAEGKGLAPAVLRLATSYGYPVLADVASNVRWSAAGPVVSHADVWLRSNALAEKLQPDFILRLGGGLTSKRLGLWLDGSGAETVLLTENEAIVDANHRARLVLGGDLVETCAALSAPVPERSSAWSDAFLSADARVEASLKESFADSRSLSEPQLAHAVVAALPDGARLVLASSMPIRDADAFAPSQARALRVFANRGLNGIDGTLSTALGVAAASGAPTVVLVGDLAFLHDLGALLIAHRSAIPLTVVVVNNDGGGIFSFLPVAGVGEAFEPLFATPHGLVLRHAGALFGATFHAVGDKEALRTALGAGLEGRLHLIEVKVPARPDNVALHHALAERAARAAEGLR